LGVTVDISVIIPFYNEEDNLDELIRRLEDVCESVTTEYELIFINDGSIDTSKKIIEKHGVDKKYVKLINLSRNFGKEIAMSAGLEAVQGDFIIVIDADLQDPPELIRALYDKCLEGFDVVYAKRTSREGEAILKKFTADLFYRFIERVSEVSIPRNTGDFRIMRKRVVHHLIQLQERHRFMKGLFAWVGFKQCELLYNREKRFRGTTKFNYWKLWNFALEGITSFTIAPLKLATYIGLLIGSSAFLYALVVIVKTLVFGRDVHGYPSLMVVTLFLGGGQLIFLGIIGEYLGRLFNEAKKRPLYIIESKINFD
jgi:polyisoprenyl-phosphate glycosyltransferase